MAEKEIIFTDEPGVSHQHVEGEPVKENEIAATCTQKGSYDKVVYCKDKDCGEELSRENITVPASGHKKESRSLKIAWKRKWVWKEAMKK